MYGCSPEACAEKLLGEGVRAVFVTLGDKGCYYASKDERGYAKGPEVTALDTTGAGDVFGGTASAMLLKGRSLREAAEIACFAASLSTERKGGISSLASVEEINKRLNQRREET